MEVLMPGYRADRRPLERPSVDTGTLFGLSTIERACVGQLIGHKLAHIEREFILQTLRFHRGNRTRAADLLGISIRSLRNKIRDYRNQGEDVPPPEASATAPLAERRFSGLRH
jgi:DNA-binding protein Fis